MPLKPSNTINWTNVDVYNNKFSRAYPRNALPLSSHSLDQADFTRFHNDNFHCSGFSAILILFSKTFFSSSTNIVQWPLNLNHSIMRLSRTKLLSLNFDLWISLSITCKHIWWWSCKTGSDCISQLSTKFGKKKKKVTQLLRYALTCCLADLPD